MVAGGRDNKKKGGFKFDSSSNPSNSPFHLTEKTWETKTVGSTWGYLNPGVQDFPNQRVFFLKVFRREKDRFNGWITL